MDIKAKQTVTVLGIKLPRWQDCTRCGAKLSCPFSKFAYNQPCDNCKNTPEYEEEQAKKDKEKGTSMSDMINANKPTGVFEHKGRYLFVNKKGNIIRDEKVKPLPAGRKDWKY